MPLKCIWVYCILFVAFFKSGDLSSESYENYLGTKTPYRVVANRNDSKLQFRECTPTKIWMLVRHGTRNPSVKLIRQMRDRLPQIRNLILNTASDLPEDLIKALRKWEIHITDNEQKQLTHEGEEEMLRLAERMQRRFPDVLSPVYSNSSYKFKFTATQRTEESAKYFTAGLFGAENTNSVYFPAPLSRDPILRFYKLCTKWRKDVKKHPRTRAEQRKFQNTTIMKNTVEEVNEKLGLANQLKFDDVLLMYQTCAFETAWNRQTKSPWCVPFSIDALKVMEYHEDLKYYWIDGYGHEITYKQACPAFGDMMHFLKTDGQEPKVTVYFTHSGTILKMLAHLNLYRESQHLVHVKEEVKEDRKWKVSKIDAFGSNLAFVLHQCHEGNKILLLHQEQIVRFPSCAERDLCDVNALEKNYSESINSCSFDEICDNKTKDET